MSRVKNIIRENWAAFILVMPILLPLFMFWVYPTVMTLNLSFTDWNYISPDYNIVGVGNYKELLTDRSFVIILVNTLVFSVATIVVPIGVGLFLSFMLDGIIIGKNPLLTGIFSSWITPTVIVSMVWAGIFDKDMGLLNQMIGFLGMGPISWLGKKETAMLSIIIVTSWQYSGIATLLLSSAMAKQDPSVKEACLIEGVKGFDKFFAITLPAISPTVFFLIILFLLDSLKAYDQIYILTQGGPAGSTSTVLYYFYVVAFEWFETGKAAAVAIVIVLISMFISWINFVYSKRWVKY